MLKQLGRTFFIAFVLSTLTGLLSRGYNMKVDLYVSFLVFAAVQYWLSRKREGNTIFFCFAFNILFVNVVVGRILDGGFPGIGIPNIFMMFIGSIVGHLCARGGALVKTISLLLGFGMASFLYVNHDRWLNYLSFGNFSGTVAPETTQEWKAYNYSKDTLSKSACAGKITVLDFWNTSCPVCFVKFPQFQELYDRYKNEPRIVMAAVNIPWEEDESGVAFKRIEDKKYNFPVVVGLNGMDSTFSVFYYPTAIVMNDNKVIYRGDLEGVEKVLQEQLRKK